MVMVKGHIVCFCLDLLTHRIKEQASSAPYIILTHDEPDFTFH